MGTFCIVLGMLLLIAFTGGGFYLSNAIISNTTYRSLLGFADVSNIRIIYIIVVGICFLIGLLICLNLAMHGMNSNKINKLQAQIRRLSK